MSNPSDEMSRFMTCVADLGKEECCIAMLYGDMNLYILTVYAQSIEESKISNMARNLKWSGPSGQNQPKFKKKAPTQNELRGPKVKLEKGSGSQGAKPTCSTCGN